MLTWARFVYSLMTRFRPSFASICGLRATNPADCNTSVLRKLQREAKWKRLAQCTVQRSDRRGQRSISHLRTPQSSEKQNTKLCSNYICSEHPEHILAQCYRTAPTFPACNVCTKGTFVLTVGDCLALNGDLGVLSAGPRAASQGYTNGERKAIKGKYHDGNKGGYEKTKLPFHDPPSIIYMVIRCSSYRLFCFIYFAYFCCSGCLWLALPPVWEGSALCWFRGVWLKTPSSVFFFPPPW